MNKPIIYIVLFLVFAVEMQAQQLPLYSQYRLNGFVINPAMTGIDHRLQASASYRKQWQQMPGGPVTASASYRSYLEEQNMGIGGYFLYDKTGPTSQIGVTGTYAYIIDFERFEVKRLAIGINAGVYQYRLRGSELITDEPDDVAVFTNNVSRFIPDAGAGVTYYTDKFYVGASVPQAISMNVRFEGVDGLSEIRRIAHFYMMGGVNLKFGVDNEFTFKPAVWAKYGIHSPVNVDLNLALLYKDLVSFGIGYNTSKTITAELGFEIAERARLYYDFGFHFSPLHSYLGFNHEVTLTYTIDGPEFYIY